MKKIKTSPATISRETKSTTNNGRYSLGGLTMIAACMVLLFSACKRDEVKPTAATGTVKTTMTPEEGKKLEARIQSFYGQMKALKGSNIQAKGAEDKMAIDSVEMLTEATYNYYVARNSDEDVVHRDFELKEPLSGSELDLSKVSEAFYRIKDSLMLSYSAIQYTDKQLASFDLEVSTDGTDAKFVVRSTIKDGAAPGPISMTPYFSQYQFGGIPNHAWLIAGNAPVTSNPIPGVNSSAVYIKSQAEFDPNTGQVTSQNSNAPGAFATLRACVLHNSFGVPTSLYTNPMLINIKAVGVNTMGLYNIPYITDNSTIALPTPWNGITEFDNSSTYSSFMETTQNPPYYNSDPDYFYKIWMPASIMNQYLAKTPAMITMAIPAGKYGFDFNVVSTAPLGYHNHPVTGEFGYGSSYGYIISYGTPTSIVLDNGSTIGLPLF